LNMAETIAATLGPCLAFPYFGRDGRCRHVRLKPDNPRVRPKGNDGKPPKPQKYEQAAGRPNTLYVPRSAWPKVLDTHLPLLIVEGEKKTPRGTQEGFATVGLAGIAAWSKARVKVPGRSVGPRELLDDWKEIPLDGRLAFLVFDSPDWQDNPDVQREEVECA